MKLFLAAHTIPDRIQIDKNKGNPYSKWALGPELIPVKDSQPAGNSHQLGRRLPLLSTRPAVTFPTRERYRSLTGTKLYC